MNIRAFAPLVLCAASLLFVSVAQAARYPVSDETAKGAWRTVTLDTASKRSFRAVETRSYSDATLSVNATEGVCHLPWLEMRVALEERQSQDHTRNLVPTRLRVDRAPLVDTMAEFFVEEDDEGFYSHFYLGDLDTLLEQMSDGGQLVIGFDLGEISPWVMTFDLEGAGPAIAEMQRRCANA